MHPCCHLISRILQVRHLSALLHDPTMVQLEVATGAREHLTHAWVRADSASPVRRRTQLVEVVRALLEESKIANGAGEPKEAPKVAIFCDSKLAVERVAEALKREVVECDAANVHMFHFFRDKEQNDWELSRFNSPDGVGRILVATDQARGLLPAATHVVMAELPTDGGMGWDARVAGAKVTHATTLLDETKDAKHVVELVRVLSLSIRDTPAH
jgi:superfamily II DNA/RNA helicase